MTTNWTDRDLDELKAHGKDPKEASRQTDFLKGGFRPVTLDRPCAVGDGILRLGAKECEEALQAFSEAVQAERVSFFVPASGAASRMFKELHAVKNKETPVDWKNRQPETLFHFFDQLKKIPFYQALKEACGKAPEELVSEEGLGELLEILLTEKGLSCQSLPKGLIPFHQYHEGARTAFEEHLWEAAAIFDQTGSKIKLHFTVSETFKAEIEQTLEKKKEAVETKSGFEICCSTQNPATDTPAATPEGELFRDAEGKIVLRPAGHGALLKNLEATQADVVLIKNIDNISFDFRRPQVVRWRSVLAGELVRIQKRIFAFLETLEGSLSEAEESEIEVFCRDTLGRTCSKHTGKDKKQMLFDILNCPLRVCGMVINEGQPGGGPFWVGGKEGELSLQIVESAQVDQNDPGQKKILMSATHFNPVDIACGLKDYKGKPFELERFRDLETAIITRKFKQGRALLALELPGLWNGAMAYWNTVFVEIPAEVFTPVKTVYDLLKPEHRMGTL